MSPAELQLSTAERRMLDGDDGPAVAAAMRLIVTMAGVAGAEQLVEVSAAHIDSCLYHGTIGLDFAERLARDGGRVRVPTTLNVAALDLLHPELVTLDDETRSRARRLMDAYVEMGCQPSWTCAPYQLPDRPAVGHHIAWAESNAIVFANSVLGARTERYGDFIDICAALTGRVPLAGLHRDDGRRAQVVLELAGLPPAAFADDELYALVGHAVGRLADNLVPAIVGLPATTSEDQLKALGAAAASSGSVALCHVVGVTPEAATLEACLASNVDSRTRLIGPAELRSAWDELSTVADGRRLTAVSLGTPHLSLAEFEQLMPRLVATDIAPRVTVYVSTLRHVVAELEQRGWLTLLERPGVQLVTDTCTYITPIIAAEPDTVVMTNSAKWAWYAPATIGVEVAFGSLADCLASAAAGEVARHRPAWLDG
jgi:predicted aconitase